MGDFFDNTDSNCSIVVTHDYATHRWDLTENFHRHRLLRNQANQSCISLVERFRETFDRLTCFSVDLGDNLADVAIDSGPVTEDQRSVAPVYLIWRAHNNYLGDERLGHPALISSYLWQHFAHHFSAVVSVIALKVQTNVVASTGILGHDSIGLNRAHSEFQVVREQMKTLRKPFIIFSQVELARRDSSANHRTNATDLMNVI